MNTDKIKILHIIPQFTTGGAEQMVLYYARLLDREKFEIVVASTVEDGSLRHLFEQHNISLFIGSRSKDGGRLGVALKLRKFVKDYQPQIIHTHLFGGDIFGWWFKVWQKMPVYWISTQHNVEFDTSLVRKFIWKHILKSADQIIAVASKVKKFDCEHFNLAEEKIKVVRNGIAVEELSRLPSFSEAGGVWQLGIVGRLSKQKGHRYLFAALSELAEVNWRLHIFGDGSDKAELIGYAKEKGIDDKIIWHGVESSLSKLYGSVDIIIQPSLWEGLSLVIMEALCAGRFVIASIPAAEELIEDKRTGLVIDQTKPEELITALQYSFKHPVEIKIMAQEARQQALENFDIQINVKKLEDLYLLLMSKPT